MGRKRTVGFKGVVNLVTEMDILSEKIIVGEIEKRFPDHAILAEERPATEKASRFLWIIDPLDGTTNYAHGFPIFSVSIALAKDEEVILGVVYDPTRDELFTAEKGKGARLNGRRIRVSSESNSFPQPARHRLPLRSPGKQNQQLRPLSQFCDPGSGRAPRRIRGFGSLLCGRGPIRRILGNEAGALGHRRRESDGCRGRREGNELFGKAPRPKRKARPGQQWENPPGHAQDCKVG